MQRLFRAVALAAVLAGAPALALAAEFTDTQRAEIGEIVREYLLNNPEVLVEASQELEKRQKAVEAERAKLAVVDFAKEIYHSPADFVAGNPQGDVTVVEFFDYNCPWCKKSTPILINLIGADKNLRIVFKEFPILGEGSEYASKAAIASMSQGKYLEFHEALFAHQGGIDAAAADAIAASVGIDVEKLRADMEQPAIAETIGQNRELAQKLGISGTPGFVVGNEVVHGYVIERKLAETIQQVRDSGSCAVC